MKYKGLKAARDSEIIKVSRTSPSMINTLRSRHRYLIKTLISLSERLFEPINDFDAYVSTYFLNDSTL